MEFNAFVSCLLHDADRLRTQANQEYGSDSDVLSHFKVAAEILLTTPQRILCTHLVKHIVSISRGVSLREAMYGRILDAINYLILLAYILETKESK